MNDPTSPAESIVADTHYEESIIARVVPTIHGWEIKRDTGWLFFVDREHGVEPKVGDVARFYGRGVGYPVRGMTLNGVVVFYSADEDDS